MEYLRQYEILLKKAKTDIAVAEALSKIRNEDIDDDVVLFHIQQATEKLLKAFLSYSGEHFAKTHDIELLFDKTKTIAPDLVGKYYFLSALDDYAVEGRYGEIGENIGDITPYLKGIMDFKNDLVQYLNLQSS